MVLMPGQILKLGIVTTGHGPRDEYARYHRGLANRLGMQIDVVEANILDGLSWLDISAHLAAPHEDRLGAHVHVPGAQGNRLGPGWDHVYVKFDWSLAYFQAAIDALVAQGADAIVFCCATLFAEGAFTSPVPLILPSGLTLFTVSNLLRTHSGRFRLGLMSSIGHGPQDVRLWHAQDYADRLVVTYEGFEGRIMPAAERLAATRHDAVVVWSYGLGLAGSDDPQLSVGLEHLLGCPVIMPHRLAAFAALSLMPGGFDDRAFLDR